MPPCPLRCRLPNFAEDLETAAASGSPTVELLWNSEFVHTPCEPKSATRRLNKSINSCCLCTSFMSCAFCSSKLCNRCSRSASAARRGFQQKTITAQLHSTTLLVFWCATRPTEQRICQAGPVYHS